MGTPSARKRIWGWYFFDWASQPYHTVLLTFIFGPFFAAIAADLFMAEGLDEAAADARAQSIWSLTLTISGLLIGFGGPVIGALADRSGNRMPWIAAFSILYILGAAALWFTDPAGANLTWMLIAFGLGFMGAEFALIFTNAQLPSLGTPDEVGRISGSGFAFGYFGGLIALTILLVFFVEQATGRTVAGFDPVLGLSPDDREGTRAAGPFAALWFAVFMIPYFLWVREVRPVRAKRTVGEAMSRLAASIKALPGRPSLATYLGGSMLYRDALNGLYGFGGTYAVLVLNWEVTQVGVFGIISVIAAAGFSFVGGRLDRRFGPKPVIITSIFGLMAVCFVIVGMSRESVFGMPLPPGSNLPDMIFIGCGILIGGLGGILQAASRSLMVRHTDEDAPTESFGLYGLSGRATAFLAPALIGLVTTASGSVQIGVSPLIFLFLSGLVLLRWVKPDGDRAVWSKDASPLS